MSRFDDLIARVGRIQRLARIALVSQCAERARPVYEALREDSDPTAFTDTIECGWRYAETGLREARVLHDLTGRVGRLLEDYLEMEHALLSDAVKVPLRLLQAMDEEEEASALATARALSSGRAVADGAEAAILPPGRPTTGTFQAEEERWQEAALDIAARWRGPASRSMFSTIVPTEGPQWLRHFLAAQRR